MTRSRALSTQGFDTGLRCLQHPLSWISIGLLLLNDHVLKIITPGMLTGKLSDFAGLFFFPFLVAIILSLILDRARIGTRHQGLAAFFLSGVGFALLKLHPQVNAMAARWVSSLYGRPSYFVLDPTDLFALLILIPAWGLWNHPPIYTKKEIAILAIGVASLASLATPPAMMDYGVYKISIDPENGGLGVQTCRQIYTSQDGGQTWARGDWGWDNSANQFGWLELNGQWTLAEAAHPEVIYRFRTGQSIERSSNGGQTWIEEFRVTPLTEAQQDFYTNSNLNCITKVIQGPLDAMIDSKTGNLVVAMGHEGALVRTPDGIYDWVQVGDYQHLGRLSLRVMGKATLREMLIGLTLGSLTILTIGLLANKKWGWLFLAIPAEVFFLWYVSQQNDLRFTLQDSFSQINLAGTIILVLLFLIPGLILVRKSPGKMRRKIVAFGLATGLMFWLPFGLWSVNLLPRYALAVGLSVVALLVTWWLGWRNIKRHEDDQNH